MLLATNSSFYFFRSPSGVVLRPILLLIAILAVASVSPAMASHAQSPDTVQPNAQESQVSGGTVTILSYNDVQTAAAKNGSLPRMANLIDQRRRAHENPTVVIGGGDQVSPHALSPVTGWQTPIEALNRIDPAVDVIGNHDLDYGLGAVRNFSEASEFPWVMANIVDAESGETIPGTKPYHIVSHNGLRIGVVGLADRKIKSKTGIDFAEQGYELRDYAEVGSRYATTLKEERNVDVVVAAAHLGIPVAKNLANRTENIDVIVVGDDEIEYPPKETDGTIIMEAEGRANHVAELNLTVEDGEVTDWNGRLLDVTENVSKDEEVARVITEGRNEGLKEEIGTTEVRLDSRFSSNYHRETAFGNLITDAFRNKTGAEVAITNAGGIRSNAVYGPGEVTVGDVYTVLPFGNRLVTFRLTGEEIEQLLASQIVTLESEEGQQYGAEPSVQVSGISYDWIGHENVSDDRHIQDTWVGGEPLVEDETYTVTVNSYMAGWDDSVFTNATQVSRTQDLYGTVVVEYIEDRGVVEPETENRIRRVDVTLGQAQAELDGEGKETADFGVPKEAVSVVPSSFYALTPNGRRVNATDVSLSNDTLDVTFEDAALLSSVSQNSTVQVYGKYTDSRYERVYFNHSVMNAEMETLIQRSPEDESTSDETAGEETVGGADSTTEPVSAGEDNPDAPLSGFGFVVGVVGVLVAVLAVRK